MRRRETTLDPAVAAELEALEAALAGDCAAEPELAALVRDVRADAPAMAPAFRARLDDRVERGFPEPKRSRPRRNLVPALAVAGCVLAALVAVALVGGGSSNDSGSNTPGASGAPAVSAQSDREQAQTDAAGGSGSSTAAAPSLATTPRTRRVERTTRLALST